MSRFAKYSSSFEFGNSPIVFLDEGKRKEWENLPESVRGNVYNMLHSCADKMEVKNTIEMLCNVIIDLEKRIQNLEKE